LVERGGEWSVVVVAVVVRRRRKRRRVEVAAWFMEF